MTTYQGSLTNEDYHLLIEKKYIRANNFNKNQIQPSSIDLTLSEECYEISASFLSSSRNIRENLEEIMINKIDLEKKYVFKKNRIYYESHLIYKYRAIRIITPIIYLNDLKMFRRNLFSVILANATKEKYIIQSKNIIPIK